MLRDEYNPFAELADTVGINVVVNFVVGFIVGFTVGPIEVVGLVLGQLDRKIWTRSFIDSVTYKSPKEYNIPWGILNCPGLEPNVPHFLMNIPSPENCWILLLKESATYKTFKIESNDTPYGELNWPSSDPILPQLSMKSPSAVKTCIRWLPLSATYTCPLIKSIVIPLGLLN